MNWQYLMYWMKTGLKYLWRGFLAFLVTASIVFSAFGMDKARPIARVRPRREEVTHEGR